MNKDYKKQKVIKYYQEKITKCENLEIFLLDKFKKNRNVIKFTSLINNISNEKLYIEYKLDTNIKNEIFYILQDKDKNIQIENYTMDELYQEICYIRKSYEYFCINATEQEIYSEFAKLFGEQERENLVKKIKKTVKISMLLIIILFGCSIINKYVIVPIVSEIMISKLEKEYNLEEYDQALQTLNTNNLIFNDYLSRNKIAEAFSKRIDGGDDYAMSISGDGCVHISLDCDGYTWIIDPNEWAEGDNPVQVSTDGYKMAILYEDGSVHCESTYGDEIDTSSWESIESIAVGNDSIYGITTSGKVKVTGYDSQKYWDNFSNVSDVIIGRYNTAIYYKDKSFISLSNESLNDIICPTIAGEMLWGISDSGKLVGNNIEIINNISKWNDLSFISGSPECLVGLKKDGTILHHSFDGTSGISQSEQWTDIVAIATGDRFLMGLQQDGKVLFAGSYPNDYYEIADFDFYTGNKIDDNN